MKLGRSSAGKIKIKTDEESGNSKAVECSCCCPPVCWNGGPGGGPVKLTVSESDGCIVGYSYLSDECDSPGTFVTCYAVQIIKTGQKSWFLNGLNFMTPFGFDYGPFFIINDAVGIGDTIYTAKWTINWGFSDVPLESMISAPTDGVCE